MTPHWLDIIILGQRQLEPTEKRQNLQEKRHFLSKLNFATDTKSRVWESKLNPFKAGSFAVNAFCMKGANSIEETQHFHILFHGAFSRLILVVNPIIGVFQQQSFLADTDFNAKSQQAGLKKGNGKLTLFIKINPLHIFHLIDFSALFRNAAVADGGVGA